MADKLSVQAELEMRITATLLEEPGWIGEAAAALGPEDFTEEGGCAELFAAIRRLFLDGKPVTPMSAVLEAGDWTRDMVRALRSSALAAVSREELDSLCRSLQERSRLRKLNGLALRLAQTTEPELAGHLVDEINGAMARRRESSVTSLREAAVEFLSNLEDKPDYLTWGMKRLDEELFVEPGDFVILGGYASSGKTLLSLQFATGLAEHWRVGYFSLETSTRKLYTRIVCARAGVSMKKIKRRELRPDDYDALGKASSEVAELPLDLIQAGGMSVSDIQAVTLQKRYQVIFVDYLQMVHAPERKTRYEEVTAISIGLHTLAQSHGVTVIALAQLARPERSRDKKGNPIPPNMNSFRESGQIEQDADVAMLLYPADPDNNWGNRILKVSKNKEGEKLALELEFHGATQTLTPVDPGKAVQQRLANEGRKAKEKARREGQESLAGFDDLPDGEEVPWDGSGYG